MVRIGEKLWLWEDFIFGRTERRTDGRWMFLYPPSTLLMGDKNIQTLALATAFLCVICAIFYSYKITVMFHNNYITYKGVRLIIIIIKIKFYWNMYFFIFTSSNLINITNPTCNVMLISLCHFLPLWRFLFLEIWVDKFSLNPCVSLPAEMSDSVVLPPQD